VRADRALRLRIRLDRRGYPADVGPPPRVTLPVEEGVGWRVDEDDHRYGDGGSTLALVLMRATRAVEQVHATKAIR
jgi:hypothetical protein